MAGVRTRPVGSRGAGFGGTHGNELLTRATAIVLIVLLALEGITLLRLDQLLREHMFIGVALIGPVLLKLASTGYRFMAYYSGAPAYRSKGPPHPLLRVLAPLLVASTAGIFATGVALLVAGHRSGLLLLAHKATFIVWAGCFGIHFLAYLPRVLGLRDAARPRQLVPGARARTALLALALTAGLGLALAVLAPIAHWHAERRL